MGKITKIMITCGLIPILNVPICWSICLIGCVYYPIYFLINPRLKHEHGLLEYFILQSFYAGIPFLGNMYSFAAHLDFSHTL